MDVQGLNVAIENRKGSVRTGTDSDGHEWRTKMKHPYGYIVGTRGADDEPVDTYVGPDKDGAPDAYVVHQHKDDGTGYDEDKVMLGFKSKKEAKEGYLAHYDDPKFLGPISRVSMDRLKELVESKKRLVKISAVPILVPLGPSGAYAEVDPARIIGRIKQREAVGLKGGLGVGALTGAGLGMLRGRRNLRSALVRGALGAGLGTVLGGAAGKVLARGRGKAEALKMVEPAGPEAKEYMRAYLAKHSQVVPGPAAAPGTAPQIAVRPPQPAQEALKKREQWRLARKAGPGVGGLLGAGLGAAIGARRGALLKGLIAGLGTGATLGWTPDMYASAREGFQRYKRAVPA
jgi:hypothetical protein